MAEIQKRGVTRRWIVTMLVAGIAWAGLLTVNAAIKPDFRDYERLTALSAGDALTAIRTTELVSNAWLSGRVWETYRSTQAGDAQTAVASAQQRLDEQSPPDQAARALRDELTPLLAETARLISDADLFAEREDKGALRTTLQALAPLGDRLDAYARSHR